MTNFVQIPIIYKIWNQNVYAVVQWDLFVMILTFYELCKLIIYKGFVSKYVKLAFSILIIMSFENNELWLEGN
jgi:hypothetical protein